MYVSGLTSGNLPHTFPRFERLYIPVVFSLLALQGFKNILVNILLIYPSPKTHFFFFFKTHFDSY